MKVKQLRRQNNPSRSAEPVNVVQPRSGWQLIDFRELSEYRDLFYFLVWRDIKVLYAQTVLGFSWAILLPLIQIVIFTIIFGKVARLSTEGIPYFLFSTVAVIPASILAHYLKKAEQLNVFDHKTNFNPFKIAVTD